MIGEPHSLRHKNLQEAAQVFESGVKRHTESWRLYTGLGLARHMLGVETIKDAVDPLIQAVDLWITDPRSYFFLATLGRIPADEVLTQVTARFERYARENRKLAQSQLYYATNLWQRDEASNETTNEEKIEWRPGKR